MSSKEEILSNKFYENQDETGLQRLQKFYIDLYNGVNRNEIELPIRGALFGLVSGTLLNGVLKKKQFANDFIRKHNDYVFENKQIAKRQYINYVFRNIIISSTKFGSRCFFLTGSISWFLTNSIIYHKDFKVLDSSVIMGTTFALTRYNRGLKAISSSFILGSLFGLIAGLSFKTSLIISKIKVKDLLDYLNDR